VIMIPARTNDDHASASPLVLLARCRLGENSGRSVTAAKFSSGGSESGGDDKVSAAPASTGLAGSDAELSLRPDDLDGSSSLNATTAKAAHNDARTALFRNRMANCASIVRYTMKEPGVRLLSSVDAYGSA
jgi:hypothetical protein